MGATVEQSRFGVIIKFDKGTYVDKYAYKLLITGGFDKVPCMSFNHWRAEASEDSAARAAEIEKHVNAEKSTKKVRIYPKNNRK